MKVVYDIHIRFIHPPIPDRSCDYEATRTGYEPGEPLGRGPTPLSALADLLDQEMNQECEHDWRSVEVGYASDAGFECNKCGEQKTKLW